MHGLLDASIDVSADACDSKVRPSSEDLGLAAGASCPDQGSLREVSKHGSGLGYQDIARVLAHWNDPDLQGIRVLRRHVLHAVNCEVNFICDQGFFQLFDEDAPGRSRTN